MSLPAEHSNTSAYFQDVVPFLEANAWLYNYPNTHVLSGDVLGNVSQDWTDYFQNISNADLNGIALGQTGDNAPVSLKEFVGQVNGFKPEYEFEGKPGSGINETAKLTAKRPVESGYKSKEEKTSEFKEKSVSSNKTILNQTELDYNTSSNRTLVKQELTQVEAEFKHKPINANETSVNSKETHEQKQFKLNETTKQVENVTQSKSEFEDKIVNKTTKMNSKKAHEVENLALVIHQYAQENDVKYIVDIGSGLGYLPQALNEQYGYKLLGIEANEKFVKTAQANASTSVKYEKLHVTSDSSTDIERLVKKNYPDFDSKKDKIGLVTLHGCADLSVNMIEAFAKTDIASFAIIMPCCYHRMSGDEEFEKFPVSQKLKKAYSGKFLSKYFLRLACQQTNSHWNVMSEEEHRKHARNFLFRNILQKAVDEEHMKIIRLKRKTGVKITIQTFDDYLENLQDNHRIIDSSNKPISPSEMKSLKTKLLSTYKNKYENQENVFEALTALQALLQGVCENVVLLDRQAYAEELGLNATTRKVTDDRISPRCLAVIVTKNKT